MQEDIKLFVGDLNKKINNCTDTAQDHNTQLRIAMDSLQQWCHKQHVHQAELVQHCEEQLDRSCKVCYRCIIINYVMIFPGQLFQVTTEKIQSTYQSQTDNKIETQSRQLREELNEKHRIVQGQFQVIINSPSIIVTTEVEREVEDITNVG